MQRIPHAIFLLQMILIKLPLEYTQAKNTRMQQTRQTKQRKIILEELRKVHTHPTAEEIFEMVKPLLPKLSLATIYRNLEFLEKQEEIIKLKHKSNDGKARYDGHADPHRHLICKECGKIVDISSCCCCTIDKKDLDKYGFTVDDGFIEILGKCKKCSTKKLPNPKL